MKVKNVSKLLKSSRINALAELSADDLPDSTLRAMDAKRINVRAYGRAQAKLEASFVTESN